MACTDKEKKKLINEKLKKVLRFTLRKIEKFSAFIEKQELEAHKAEIKINAYMLDKSEQNEAEKYFEHKLAFALFYDFGICIMFIVSFYLTIEYYTKFWFITLAEQGEISGTFYIPVIFCWLLYLFLKFNPVWTRYHNLEKRYFTIQRYYEMAEKSLNEGENR